MDIAAAVAALSTSLVRIRVDSMVIALLVLACAILVGPVLFATRFALKLISLGCRILTAFPIPFNAFSVINALRSPKTTPNLMKAV